MTLASLDTTASLLKHAKAPAGAPAALLHATIVLARATPPAQPRVLGSSAPISKLRKHPIPATVASSSQVRAIGVSTGGLPVPHTAVHEPHAYRAIPRTSYPFCGPHDCRKVGDTSTLSALSNKILLGIEALPI